jgi:ArsR family transcriptional regulator
MPRTTQELIRSIEPDALARAADIIKLLGHADRLKIVEVLEDAEATVSEIQDILEMPQAIVSQHLAKMRGCNVVAARRDGNHVFYRIIEPKVHHILHCIRHCDM